MLKIKKIMCRLIPFGLATVMLFSIFSAGIGIGSVSVYASTAAPTIRIGENPPMTFEQFHEWRNERGIRFFRFEESIYPADIFFEWGSGQAFNYGEIRDRILFITLASSVNTDNASTSESNVQNPQNPQNPNTSDEIPAVPFLITDLTPILLSYDELSALIESVPHQNPMDIRSSITLPNRRLTESELAAWIDEYNEMGGVTSFELSVIREINRVREHYGLNPLALDPTLMLSTRFKTQEFGDLQYYAHISPINGGVTAAARMFGFDGLRVSETITRAGASSAPVFRTTPENIVSGMLASSRGHRQILLNPDANSVGFGAFFSPTSTGPNGRMSHMFYFATQFGFYN